MIKKILSFLPSKTVGAFIIIPTLSLVSFFILSDLIKEKKRGGFPKTDNLTRVLKEELVEKDGDGDGLVD
jgi:hypothetical protein